MSIEEGNWPLQVPIGPQTPGGQQLWANFYPMLRKIPRLKNTLQDKRHSLLQWEGFQLLFKITELLCFQNKKAASKKLGIWKKGTRLFTTSLIINSTWIAIINRREVRIPAPTSVWMSTSGSNYHARTVDSVIWHSQGFIVLVNKKFCFVEDKYIYELSIFRLLGYNKNLLITIFFLMLFFSLII